MELKKIIEEIKAERPEITSVIFVGCGASQAELYPAKYFLEGNAKKLRTRPMNLYMPLLRAWAKKVLSLPAPLAAIPPRQWKPPKKP